MSNFLTKLINDLLQLLGAVHILRNAVGGEGGFPRPLLIVTGRGVGGQECVT